MIMPLLVMVVLASLLWEPVQRWFLLSGRPFEMMIMNSQKNLMLATAIVGCWASYQRLSMLIGVSLAIFCAAVTREDRVHWLVALYGFAAVSWLVASYWDTLQARLIAGESRRLPWRWLIVLPSIPLLLLLATATGGQSTITSLRGFLPGSGGDGRADDFSRGGVNDGDALVAGQDNIKSFGPIEDAPFADDNKPSLYDVFNDTFDEPVQKIKDQESSIALPPEMMAEIKARMAKSEQAGREFSTLRRNTKPDQRKIKDLESHALLYVAGRVPLHLRMEVYDIFDGINWIPEALSSNPPGMAIVTSHGRPWLRVPCGGRGLEIHVGADTHAIKVINLRSPVIPAPLDLRSIHIDKVDRADMFGWYRDSIVQMTRKALPELVSINLTSECMDQSLLPDHPHLSYSGLSADKRVQLPQNKSMDAVRALAEEWTRGIPGRFRQIEAIRDGLKNNYTLDRSDHAPEDCEFPVSHFLFESKRGADFQFATAAVLMLRSLGFSTRLVSGFYADPERYDARRRHTAVHSSDVHFWCEVFLGGGTWATLDPTPGYEVLGPPPGFWKRIRIAMTELGRGMVRRWLLVSALLLTVAAMFRFRRYLIDFVDTALWRLAPAKTPRGRILQTVRLMDRRLRYAGVPRPAGVTLGRWLRQQPRVNPDSNVFTQFINLADWAAFGEKDHANSPDASSTETCCLHIGRELKLSQVLGGRFGDRTNPIEQVR
jgi:transglutaminase-like putative cysteine protease